MPEITGVEFSDPYLTNIQTHRILLTGFTEIDVIINAINIGHIYQFIRKPYLFMEMKNILIGQVKYIKCEKIKI